MGKEETVSITLSRFEELNMLQFTNKLLEAKQDELLAEIRLLKKKLDGREK